MSYILDALRKSEQERQRGKVPDIHGAVADQPMPGNKPNIWPIITVVVILVNVGILLFFALRQSDVAELQPALVTPEVPNIAPRQSVAATPAVLPAPSVQPGPSLVPQAKPQERVSASAGQQNNSPEQPIIIKPKTSREQEPVPQVGYLPQLEELPAYERDGIPDMTFSSHMYSSMPKFRSIIINGKRLKEGQFLNEELQVREITESGVVMSRGSTLFEVDVLGRWAQ